VEVTELVEVNLELNKIPMFEMLCAIIKHMENHDNLEEFQNPENYDLEEAQYVPRPLAFYQSLAQEFGSPILDIACGTGLYALPMAELGFEVTGIDLAKPMLEYARQKALAQNLELEFVYADARDFKLGKQFRFAFMTGNAFQMFLTRADQDSLLNSIKLHLAPNGVFAFETRNPSGHNLQTNLLEEDWFQYQNVDGLEVKVSGIQEYDPETQILHWTTYRRFADSRALLNTTRIDCKFTSPEDLNNVLNQNGLRVLRQYGNWNKEPLIASSSSIITVCALKVQSTV
jgi:2-polyprenyl-3-methyl-5-hydroxy-6-metoxy-1,4-benzoquinol methylase